MSLFRGVGPLGTDNAIRCDAMKDKLINAFLVAGIAAVTTLIVLVGWRLIEQRIAGPQAHWNFFVGKSTHPQPRLAALDMREPFRTMQEEVDALFADAFRDFPTVIPTPAGAVRDDDRGVSLFFQQMQRMQQDIDRMFQRRCEELHRMALQPRFDDGWETLAVTPSLDMRETTNAVIIAFHLPGVQKSDIHIAVAGQVLKVAAVSSNAQKTASGAQASRRQFERHVRLPFPPEQTADIKANFEGDTLTIVVPKPSHPILLEKEVPLG